MTTLLLERELEREEVADELALMLTIAKRMLDEGLPKRFAILAQATALEYEGVRGLMQMWDEETDLEYRKEIEADIQDMIDDCAKKGYTEGPYIRFDDLEAVRENIRVFKDSLRKIVDERGGINRLVELTGIPQASLSRFFNSGSMPRRTTLNKIATALNLSQVEIATPWSRD